MGLISEDIIKKVRESNDIVDIVGSYLPLTQKGKNFFAVCPFHDDHSPSMSISREKQIFRCFVCGATGNVITFVKDYEKVSFGEAVEILGKNAGINLSITKKNSANSPYKEFYEIYSIATSYYKNNLNTKSGEKARTYLKNRNLNKEVLDYFDIGLSLTGGLVSSLSKTYGIDKLTTIGLARDGTKDLFTNRIMFTIKDNYGNPVGFSGRIYEDRNDPKYINSKETVIFKKGTILYNFWRAKDFIRKKKEIIISEGFMEVIRLHTIGFDNVVALMGTSFTKEHLELIKNMKVNVVLNLDQDDAGKIATLTIGEMLMSVGINPTVIIFSKHKDADELIVNEGDSAFINAYNNKVSFIDFKLNYLKQNKDLTKAEELSKYIKDAIDAINDIEDDILKEVKIKWLSKEYEISEELIRNKITKKTNPPNITVKTTEPKKKQKYNKYDKSEIRLLYLMLNNKELIKYYENHLGYMCNEKRRKLANSIVTYTEKHKTFDYADFLCYTIEYPELDSILKEVMEYKHEDEYTMKEVEDYITNIKELRVKKQIETLTEKMKNTIDIEEKKKLASRIENIKKEVLKW